MGGTGKDRTLRRLGAQASLPREFPTPEVSRDPVWQPDPAWPFLAQTSEQVPAPTSKGSRLTSAFSQLADQSASSLTAVPVWECGMKVRRTARFAGIRAQPSDKNPRAGAGTNRRCFPMASVSRLSARESRNGGDRRLSPCPSPADLSGQQHSGRGLPGRRDAWLHLPSTSSCPGGPLFVPTQHDSSPGFLPARQRLVRARALRRGQARPPPPSGQRWQEPSTKGR